MDQPNQLIDMRTAKPPRKENRIRHHWGIHVSEKDDQTLTAVQAHMFARGFLPKNTKHALIRRLLNLLLDKEGFPRIEAEQDVRASPIPAPAPAPLTNPVATTMQVPVSLLQAQIDAAVDARLRALATMAQARGGVSQ